MSRSHILPRQTPELKISKFRLAFASLIWSFGIILLIWNEWPGTFLILYGRGKLLHASRGQWGSAFCSTFCEDSHLNGLAGNTRIAYSDLYQVLTAILKTETPPFLQRGLEEGEDVTGLVHVNAAGASYRLVHITTAGASIGNHCLPCQWEHSVPRPTPAFVLLLGTSELPVKCSVLFDDLEDLFQLQKSCNLSLLWMTKEAVRVNRIVTSMIENIHKVTNPKVIDERNEGSLIYIYSNIRVEEPLTEPEYGLSVPAVVLKRRVQMYQWVEKIDERSEDPDSLAPYDLFHYDMEWKDKVVDSSNFFKGEGHENPKEFPVKSHTYLSPHVKIGAYTLSTELKSKFDDFRLITSDERPERHDIKMHAGLYYHTTDVWNPKVGDIRIQFSYAGISDETVSIIATQTGSELTEVSLLLLEKDKVSPSDMITNAHNWNMWLVRLYRTVGWLCLYLASTFAKSLFFIIGKKYRKAYMLLSLDRRVSPYTSASSAVTAVIVCSIWTVYKPAIGALMIIMFISPFIWCASSLESKENRNDYKRI